MDTKPLVPESEDIDFATLEANVAQTKAVCEDARKEFALREQRRKDAESLLAQAHAAKAGISVGTTIEFRYGPGMSRARVETIQSPRFNYYGNVFDLSVRAILRDGSDGKRLSIVESNDFLPQEGFTTTRPPRARIVQGDENAE